MDMIKAILEKAEDFAIKKNDRNLEPERQGVLFANFDTGRSIETEAWVISKFGIVRFSNLGLLDFPEDAPFFSYIRREWLSNETHFKRAENLREVFYSSRPNPFEKTPIPVGNYLNRISFLYGSNADAPRINKSRTIIRSNPGLVFEGDILLKYNASRNTFENKAGVVGRLSEHSHIMNGFKDGKAYHCNVVGKDGSEFIVNVRDFYFKGMEILIHESVGVYYPSSEKEIIDASNYYKGEIVPNHPRVIRYAYPLMPENGYHFQPIHIETPSLFYILSMFEGFDWADLFVDPKSRLSPIFLESVGPEDGIKVEAIVGPLDPVRRGYHL